MHVVACSHARDLHVTHPCVHVISDSGHVTSCCRYLNYSISQLRSQDTLSAITYISYNVYGRYLAWNFVRSNWQYLAKT